MNGYKRKRKRRRETQNLPRTKKTRIQNTMQEHITKWKIDEPESSKLSISDYGISFSSIGPYSLELSIGANIAAKSCNGSRPFKQFVFEPSTGKPIDGHAFTPSMTYKHNTIVPTTKPLPCLYMLVNH